MVVTLRSVLVSDAVDPLCVELLKNHGINVICKYKLPKDQLIQELQTVDGLIVRSDTKVTKDVINNAPGLRVIGRAGTGVDNIDLDAATRRGIIVINTPGGNSISACEMTCALISSLARNVPQACQSLKEGRWDRKLYTGCELNGKTLAVLGLGRIGREVATRMQSYGMRTVGFDPIVSADDAKSFGVEKMELEQIWPIADYITVHTPLIPQTKNLINAKTLGKCKKGVNVVNVARGGIVDEEALLNALKDGQCGGAALDVYIEEPPKCETTLELIKHPLVIATPHLGASTDEAQQRVAIEIAEQFVAISGKNKDDENFAVTGAVNAPVLAATMVASNLPWISVTQGLGQILGRIVPDIKSSDKIVLTTSGDELKSKNFLTFPALAGLLEKSHTGVNLINAPGLAKDEGLNVDRLHVDGPRSVTVSVGSYSISGTIGSNDSPVFTQLGDAIFSSSVAINGNLTIFKSSSIELGTLLNEIKQNGGAVNNVAVGKGKSETVVVVHTEDPLKKFSSVNATAY